MFVAQILAAVRRVCRTGLLINAAVAAGYCGAKAWDEITRRLDLSRM